MYEDVTKELRNLLRAYKVTDNGSCHQAKILASAADAIEELRKAVLRLEDESGIYDELPTFYIYPTKWIPATEQLPDIGKDVLCFCRANIFFVLGWDGYHWHEGVDRYYMSSFVTHWMPLPEAPKEE